MKTDPNFQFIRDKIGLLRSAVMYSMSNSLVKLPNDIINLVKIDEEGQLWFLAHFPQQSLAQCEQDFPVRLHFFRKGYDFFVEVSGKASIENSLDDPGEEISDMDARKAVLVRMTMCNIEYREPHARKEKTRLQVLVEKSYQWMLRNIGLPHTENPFFGKIHQSH
ncbi:MAG: hypothetical protein ABIR30_07645 [Chitinophagaceae bacterium]